MRLKLIPFPVLVIDVDGIPRCADCLGKVYGPVVLVRRASDTRGTEAHELFHARVWWIWMLVGTALAAAAWHLACPVWWAPIMVGLAGDGIAGKLVRAYRAWEEVGAYAADLEALGWPEALVPIYARTLASAYDLGLTQDEAQRALLDRR